MDLQLRNQLFDKYPTIYNPHHLHDGIGCQDGWFTLLCELGSALSAHQHQLAGTDPLIITEIKQDNGALRIVHWHGDQRSRQLIDAAEQRAATICELDGKPAETLYVCAPRWFRYLCQTCAELHECMTIDDYLADIHADTNEHLDEI